MAKDNFNKINVNDAEIIPLKNGLKNKEKIEGKEEEINFYYILKIFPQLFFLNAVYFLYLQLQNMIIVGFLNKKYNNEIITNTFGIASTIINLTSSILNIGFTSTLCVFGSYAYSGNKRRLLMIVYNRIRLILFTCLFIISIVLSIFGRIIVKKMGFNSFIQEYFHEFISLRVLVFFLESEVACLVILYQIIGKSFEASLFTVLSICVIPLISFFFVYFLNIGLLSAAFILFLNNVFLICLLVTYLYLYDNYYFRNLIIIDQEVLHMKQINILLKMGLPIALTQLYGSTSS
jgi:hypothetical protein